jgi:hypothetical protein
LQSPDFPSPINGLGFKAYQDKACTSREPDTKAENPEKQNPGALAGATGADSIGRGVRGKEYPKPIRGAMSRFALDRHKAMARTIGYALTIGDESGWQAFAAVAEARLTPQERAALAYAALMSLSPDHAWMVADAAIVEGRV